MTDHLHETIDRAAEEMLTRCGKEVDGRPIPMSHQVECFVAIVKWAEVREKIKPKPIEPEKGESTYELLQREFHGKPKPGGKRRGRPPRLRPDEEYDDVGETERAGDQADVGESTDAAAYANGAGATDGPPPGRPADDEPFLDGGDALDG